MYRTPSFTSSGIYFTNLGLISSGFIVCLIVCQYICTDTIDCVMLVLQVIVESANFLPLYDCKGSIQGVNVRNLNVARILIVFVFAQIDSFRHVIMESWGT